MAVSTSKSLKNSQFHADQLTDMHELEAKRSQLLTHLQDALWKRQRADGHWHYPLNDSITMNAEYIMFLRWMDENDETLISRLAQFILNSQLPDGSWNIWYGGPGNLSASIESYFALRLANIPQSDPRLQKAREFILSHGGIPKARVFTKIWFALFNLYSWKGIPIIPPEIMLSPRGTPFHINEFSYWSRSVIIPLTILFHHKKMKHLNFNLDELYLHEFDKEDLNFPEPLPVDDTWIVKGPSSNWKWVNWEQVFISLTDAANFYEKKSPVKPFRTQALEKARSWILKHQEPEGDWAGIQPAIINSIMALYACGMKKTDNPIQKGFEALHRITRGVSQDIETHTNEDPQVAVLQSCVSPIWDTALAALALVRSGIDPKTESLQKTKDWLWNKRITKKGDWYAKSKLKPGQKFAAWCFQYFNAEYPDLDDTTITALTLHKLGMSKEELKPAINWIFGMQNPDGGWGTFDRDNTQWILNEIPFADLKSLIDPSNPDCTGHVLETLGEMGFQKTKSVERAIRWLKRTQRDSGSWFGRWGVHTIYGTCAAVVGMRRCDVPVEDDSIQRALKFILTRQNPDGGWGEDCNNYSPNVETGVGNSTPSQTAWALMTLKSCQLDESEYASETSKAYDFLISRIQEDGLREDEFTGTGFPLHFYLRYDGYRNYFPLLALNHFSVERE